MITIKYLPNRFDKAGRIEKRLKFSRESRLSNYLSEFRDLPFLDHRKFDIIVSGKVVKDFKEFINDGDEIIITPKIEDPATIFGIIATIATAVGASATVAATIAAVGTLLVIGATLAAIGYSIYLATQSPSLPSFGTSSGGGGLDEGSPTYGWDGIRTNRDVNLPVPIIYGEHKVGGTAINEYIWTDGDKNYLNTLLALCEGEIESVSSIKINDNPIANFSGVVTTTKTGVNNQTVIPNFEDLHNIVSVNIQLLKDSPYTYTTIDNDVEAFEIKLLFPGGLYQADGSTGEILSWQVSYKVEYKLSSSGTWIDLGTTTVSEKTRSAIRRVFRKDGLTAGRYDIRVTRTSNNSSLSPTQNGDLYLQSVDEINTDDLSYPNTALLGVEAIAQEQLSGASPNYSCIVKGRKISVPRVMNGGSEVDWTDYYWDPATNQFKLFAGGTVLSWDGSTYVTKWSANPIWCFKDLLTNSRYGLGDFITSSLIDSALFLEMAKYCEEKVPDGSGGYEKRFRLDVAIDSVTKALDLINQLSATFNAFAFYSAGNVKFYIDKPTSPVQVFGMGNIIEGSFQQSWKSIRETPNMIDVQYLDKSKDYEQETVAIIDEASLTAGDPIRKHQIRLFTTRTSQALRVGRYALKVAQNIDRVVSFKAAIDAIACQVGDLIDISHDVPQWGFSGRVKAGSTTTAVVLDQQVVIAPAKTYKLEVRFMDDTIEERTVSNSAGTYSTLNVSSAFSQAPADYCVYAFGETDIQSKPFRVISIQRDNKDEANITAVEYNEAVYDDSAVTIPTNNYSALNRDIPSVSAVTVVEKNVLLNDGTIGSIIEVYFIKPVQTNYILTRYAEAKIYISDDNGVSWQVAGTTSAEFFAIQETFNTGTLYKVAVVSVSGEGAETAIAASPQGSVTIQGKSLPPSNVTFFDVSQQGNQLHFSWSPVTDSDLARYVIKKGSDWATGDIIAEKVDVTEFDYPIGSIGEETYMIKAIDTSGNESTNTTSDTLIVSPPPEMNFTFEIDPWNSNREYKLTNLALEKMNLFDLGYVRDVFALATTSTWESIAGSGKGWDQAVSDGDLNENKTYQSSGSYEEVIPWDLGTIFEFKIIVALQYKNVTGGSITVQVSTSEDDITYSAFANVNGAANYRTRYLKFKFNLATSDTNHNIYFYSATIFINAATVKVDFGRDLRVSASGSHVNFRSDFTAVPRITGLSIKNGIIGFPVMNNMLASGADIFVYDKDGAAIGTADVDWEVKGS